MTRMAPTISLTISPNLHLLSRATSSCPLCISALCPTTLPYSHLPSSSFSFTLFLILIYPLPHSHWPSSSFSFDLFLFQFYVTSGNWGSQSGRFIPIFERGNHHCRASSRESSCVWTDANGWRHQQCSDWFTSKSVMRLLEGNIRQIHGFCDEMSRIECGREFNE